MAENNNKQDRLISFFEWIKNNPFWLLPLFILIFLLCMLFVRIGYWLGFSLFTISYENALLFLGSFLAFIGTVFLGIVSYTQNTALTKENKHLQEKLQNEKLKAEERLQSIKIESEKQIAQFKIDWEKEQIKTKNDMWYKSIQALINAYKTISPDNTDEQKLVWINIFLESDLFYDFTTASSIFAESFEHYYKCITMNVLNMSLKKKLLANYSETFILDEEMIAHILKLEETTFKYFDALFNNEID